MFFLEYLVILSSVFLFILSLPVFLFFSYFGGGGGGLGFFGGGGGLRTMVVGVYDVVVVVGL